MNDDPIVQILREAAARGRQLRLARERSTPDEIQSDDGTAQLIQVFKRGRYSLLCVTGGPLERGEPLSEYKTYAELGAAILVKAGLATNLVSAIPAPITRRRSSSLFSK